MCIQLLYVYICVYMCMYINTYVYIYIYIYILLALQPLLEQGDRRMTFEAPPDPFILQSKQFVPVLHVTKPRTSCCL